MEKLVRDNIPEIIKADGKEPEYRVAPKKQRIPFLLKKLIEETQELVENPTDISEHGDVKQVLEDLQKELGIRSEDIEKAKAQKLKERGNFSKGYILKI